MKTDDEKRQELHKKLHDQKQDDKDFDDTLVEFCFSEPFYSALSRQVHKRPSEQVPTAGVTVDNATRMHMLWNRKFFEKLHWYERQELLKHEFLHLILNHCTSRIPKRNQKNDFAWGWATDFAINSLLDEFRLPKGGLIPGKWPQLSEDEKKKFKPDQIQALEALGNLIRSFPKKESAEWYYDKLTNDPDVRKAMEMYQDKTVVVGPGLLDDHDGWRELDSEEAEVVKQVVKNMVQKAIDECDRKRKWGSVPMEMQNMLRRLTSKQVNWKALLRNFVGMARSLNHTRTMKRIDRRYPYVHPGVKRGRSSRIAIAIDESGSVTDHELELFFAELDQLAHMTEFVVIPFDSAVREDKIFIWKRGQKVKPERVTCGGTNFSVPTAWVNKHSKRFDGMIIMTDGGCGKPIPCKLKRAYIISPGNKLYFDTNELVIQMEEPGTSDYVSSRMRLVMDEPPPSRVTDERLEEAPPQAGTIAPATRSAEACPKGTHRAQAASYGSHGFCEWQRGNQ